MVTINDITITSLETISAYDISNGEPLFIIDELHNAKISNSQDKTDITGKNGRKLNSLKKNKAVTVSGTNGLVSCGLLALQTGGEFESKSDAEVKWVDYLTIKENKACTNYKATGTDGAEIEALYIKDEKGALGTKLEQGTSTDESTFTYNPANKTLTFHSTTAGEGVEAEGYEDGTEIVVFYTRKINGSVLKNVSDTYSGKCQLYIDAFGEDKCARSYHVQFYIPKADFNGNFDFDMGDNQTVHSFEAEALAGACGVGGALWTYTVFGIDDNEETTENESGNT